MVVLQTAVNPVRIPVVDSDAIELPVRNVVHARVRHTQIPALIQAAVTADEHMSRIARIDPHGVMIGLETDIIRG
jgi:hypothetical protein